MIFLPPYVIHGTHSISEEEVKKHREIYYQLLNLLSDDKIDIEKSRKFDYLNDVVKQIKEVK